MPLAGPVTTDVVSAPPPLSLTRTLTVTGVSSVVMAESFPATGGLWTAATVTVTVVGALLAAPSQTR